jgi:aldehyde:ferredoxin oxidoreductase
MVASMTGRILWVNLTTRETIYETVPEAVYEQYLGGVGLAVYLLLRRIPAGADPLGPENVIGFVSGLLTGTGSLMTGRWVLVGKSPLTGTWGDANCGGDFSPALKRCGVDGIFFQGMSQTPVYLLVDDQGVQLLDASDLWGLDTKETDRILKRGKGSNASIACIGEAGEKLSLMAGVVNDQGRLAARGGLGAVMGSKRLKAVVLNGTKKITAFDPNAVRTLSKKFQRWIDFQPPFLSGKAFTGLANIIRWLPLQMRQDGLLYKILLKKWGTLSMNVFSIETGDAPVKNWKGSSVDFRKQAARAIDPDLFRNREDKKYSCYSCTLGCGGISKLAGGEEIHKPEYETIIAWTSLLLNDDFDSIFEINDHLNRAGMDSISAGAVVAFAFECFENGLISTIDTNGLELKWGDSRVIIQLLDIIIQREGIGDLLADGVRAASARIGKDSDQFAIHAGGQELAMHDGRNDPGYAIHAVVDSTPGRHTTGSFLFYEMYQLWRKVKTAPRIRARFYPKLKKYKDPKEKAAWAAATARFNMVMSSTGLCMFGAFMGVHRLPIFEWINAATGWNKTPDEYMIIGGNIQSLRKEFNLLHQAASIQTINARAVGKPPQSEGANQNRTVDLDPLVREYFIQMGWQEPLKNEATQPNICS